MNPLTQEWREKAAQSRSAGNSLLADERAELLAGDVRQQIQAIVFKLGAMILEGQADILDYLEGAGPVTNAGQKRRAYMEKSKAIRDATAKGASTGDWSEFERLTGAVTDVGSTGSGS